MTLRHLTLALCLIATGAIAHEGVKNADVKARMDMMTSIKDATGVLGGMAKAPATFDGARAAEARAQLITLSGQITEAFGPEATDPKSEASPAIWQNWDDFTAKADAITRAAEALDPTSADGVATGMQAIGASCGSCHRAYRL